MSYTYCWQRATSFRLPSWENVPKSLSFPLHVLLGVYGAPAEFAWGGAAPVPAERLPLHRAWFRQHRLVGAAARDEVTEL